MRHRTNSSPEQRLSASTVEGSGHDKTETIDSPSTRSANLTTFEHLGRNISVIKGEQGLTAVHLTQEDSQFSSQISNMKGQVLSYETRMQKRMKEFCNRTSIETLIAQHKQIQEIKPSRTNAFLGMLPVNYHKNRYSDIYCLDSSRVILHRRSGDYIHANYVRHKILHNDFILTQGPLPNTVDDFWEMIWQERSGLIFMLCKYIEEHRVKCVEYLPTLQTRAVTHAGIRIELRGRSKSKMMILS
ncbi:Protein-tyrosine phosphatase [Dirofilaria immitis]|nr:Protein-tyrosine phosphatase [Dirofilaria immitis]